MAALSREFTGDGEGATPPLQWSGAPAGTRSFALVMHHIPGPGDVKWYWVLYNIPADVHSLPKNVKGIGTLGNNSVNGRTEYAPPHSKGPGAKNYILTIYALSAAPKLNVPPEQVDRARLLAAISSITLSSAELRVTYDRTAILQAAREIEPPKASTSHNFNAAERPLSGFARIPAGKFEMGDHYGYHDEKHESHEVPIHTVRRRCLLYGHQRHHKQAVLPILELFAGPRRLKYDKAASICRAGTTCFARRERCRPIHESAGIESNSPCSIASKSIPWFACAGTEPPRIATGLVAKETSAVLQHDDMGMRLQQERVSSSHRG